MDESLRQATLGATNIQTPTSPLGNFPELAKLYQSSFQLPQSSGAASALTGQAQQVVAEQKAAKDPSNYQRVKKADGGYAFFDSSGREISAADYAYATGTNPSKVLADSENPIDLGYQEDYNNLQDYIHATLNSKTNSDLAAKAKDVQDKVKKAYGVDLAKMTPYEIIEKFKSQYPTVYGRTNKGVPVGQTFIPQADTGSSSKASDLFAKYGINVAQ